MKRNIARHFEREMPPRHASETSINKVMFGKFTLRICRAAYIVKAARVGDVGEPLQYDGSIAWGVGHFMAISPNVAFVHHETVSCYHARRRQASYQCAMKKHQSRAKAERDRIEMRSERGGYGRAASWPGCHAAICSIIGLWRPNTHAAAAQGQMSENFMPCLRESDRGGSGEV